MSAYVIVDIDVHDEPGLAEYRKLVPATVEKYGGRFAVRGGKFETRRAAGGRSGSCSWSSRAWTPRGAGHDSPEYARTAGPCASRPRRPTW